MTYSSIVAERLLAHARLCRQVADLCWSTEIAVELDIIADECARLATRLVEPITERRASTVH